MQALVIDFWSYNNYELSKPQQTSDELQFEMNMKVWIKNDAERSQK